MTTVTGTIGSILLVLKTSQPADVELDNVSLEADQGILIMTQTTADITHDLLTRYIQKTYDFLLV
jgi:hypothetical protein